MIIFETAKCFQLIFIIAGPVDTRAASPCLRLPLGFGATSLPLVEGRILFVF